ncbi:toxin-antitoxin system YwqK family antitoxin [Aestuariivivens sediminicola]|uniref:toxin-antitoxin system YwqK family antitoxin n=1 Tax=Aestuariivivens sediminicola TaxID=2913560 RepID=UPI001F583980|nr:hypothetical protein [Aestuariivivens sediminicola]
MKTDNLHEINFDDVMEINGLVYSKKDSVLVSGKIVKYNKKDIPKSYILVSEGKPSKYGWIHMERKYQVPEKKFKRNTNLPVYNEQGRIIGSVEELKIDYMNDVSERNDIYEMLQTNQETSILNKENISVLNTNKKKEVDKDGLWEKYYPNGNIEIKGSYFNGKKDGQWEEFYINGGLKRKTIYKAGLKEGLWLQYHPNSQLWGKGHYKDDQMVGIWNYYDESGKLILTENYDD